MKKVVVFVSPSALNIMDYSAIKHSMELGYSTAIVVDHDFEGNIDFVDYVIYTDTKNINTTITDLVEFQKRHEIAAILTYSDPHVEVVAAACDYFNLYGATLVSAQNCRNKYLCRNKQSNNGWVQPKYALIKSINDFRICIEQIGIPAILKPLNGMGSAFTVLIENKNDAENQYLLNSSNRESSFLRQNQIVSEYWILEECLEGFQISVESFTFDGETKIVCINDKLNPILPPLFRVEFSATPSPRMSNELVQEVEELTIKALKTVGFKNGIAHTEFRISEKGPQLLEINIRMGGGLIPQSVFYSTGINLCNIAVDISLGIKPDIKPNRNTPTVFKVIYPKDSGSIKNVNGFENLINSQKFDIVQQNAKQGDIVTLGSRIGLVLISAKQNESIEDLIYEINKETSHLQVEIEHLELNNSILPNHINYSTSKKKDK